MFRRTWSVSFTKQKHVPSFPLWHSVSRKTISRTPDRKEKERKQLQQMRVAGATTSCVERWKWELEYLNGLMRPEITHYLLKITVELADILGIELHEGK